ncbi:hypothetical protein KFZ76_00235 [Methylovulum psychrotolerans]|uniref:hypothetical protein n=1 Tax=Methylovulum psychrotolerans TaxID=1704499 RepID=UPI001BFF5CCD|nr:hypothetical protein [Methylovulum psychrotolerans]MBT9096139.1 hypothetical protein [Methylovulum psychrotolerans]
MKKALLFLSGVIIVAVAAYFVLFPRDTFISFSEPNSDIVTFSSSGVSFESAPDQYASNGFDHIQPYVARLLVPSKHFQFLHIFTPDDTRSFSLSARGGVVEAGLSFEWRQEPQREAAIRKFFSSLGIEPSQDYLAGNGELPDAIRILDYPVSGNTTEITALTKRILQELCSISATEALNISFKEK